MPRNTREWAQRKLKEANGQLDWAVKHLDEVGGRYHEDHPEISLPIADVMTALMEIAHAIEQIGMSF